MSLVIQVAFDRFVGLKWRPATTEKTGQNPKSQMSRKVFETKKQ